MSATAKKKAAPKKRRAPKISPALRKFLSEWLAWAEAGGPENYLFNRSLGLCGASYLYSGSIKLRVELQEKLAESLRDFTNPFSGGYHGFEVERVNRTMHKNPLRLAWVRKTLGRKAVAEMAENKRLREALENVASLNNSDDNGARRVAARILGEALRGGQPT